MRSDAYIRVTCDSCGEEEEIQLTALAQGAYDERGANGKLKALGWQVTEDGEICQDCSAESLLKRKETK